MGSVTITRADVADLQPGDVVELRDDRWPGVTTTGTLTDESDGLRLGMWIVRDHLDGCAWESSHRTLTVVSRAPRLYVNHPRTEPVPGDVVRDADDGASNRVWVKNVAGFSNEWLAVPGHVYVPRSQLPARLRLLVDGETGLPPAVQS